MACTMMHDGRKIRYTGRCHALGCRKYIDEQMARLSRLHWFFCPECARMEGVGMEAKPPTDPFAGIMGHRHFAAGADGRITVHCRSRADAKATAKADGLVPWELKNGKFVRIV